jgi:hypothetical protein
MLYRNLAAALILTAAPPFAMAQAADDAQYPEWKGAWTKFGVPLPTQPSHDQTKPWGFGQ